MQGAYLGPRYSDAQIRATLDAVGAVYEALPDAELMPRVAGLLAEENVVGWFQGRMEFGPRALGGRSILGDPRSRAMQSVMNLKIKYRESFRPFAPSVLADRVSDWFELATDSPYMLLVADVRQDKRIAATETDQALSGIDRLKVPRSQLPAVTHVDYSARIQTVHEATNPRYHACSAPLPSRRAVRCWSTPRSTCVGSPSCAPLRMRIAASCAPRWTLW
jgi:carbamoyltransferase